MSLFEYSPVLKGISMNIEIVDLSGLLRQAHKKYNWAVTLTFSASNVTAHCFCLLFSV